MKDILRWTATIVIAIVMVWFFLPTFRGIPFGIGTIFGELICVMGLVFLWKYHKLIKQGKFVKVFTRTALIIYIAGLIWIGYLSVLMLSAVVKKPPLNTNVIVLGAQVHKSGSMSKSLAQRVNAAEVYLANNDDSVCIVTGGQGDDEPFAEALAQKKALLKAGILEERIFLEDESRNTRQNVFNAKEIANENKLGNEVVIVTQSFHLFRAVKLAESAGFTAYGLPAKTDPLLFPGFYGREILSLTKWKLEELFL